MQAATATPMMMPGGSGPVTMPSGGVPGAARPAPGAFPTNNAALWVGDLAPDVTAQDLFDVFNATAQVASLRLCRNPNTGASKGYAYVNFTTVADAAKVMDVLNYTPFKGQPCRIMWANRDSSSRASHFRSSIVVKRLADTVGPKELHDLASPYGDIVTCKVPIDRETGRYRGYGFVHFDSLQSALDAVEELNESEYEGSMIEAELFKPVEERRAAERWTNVYIKQYPRSWREADVRALVAPFGDVTSLFFPTADDGTGVGFCFVNFATPEAARRVVDELNGRELPNPDHVPASGDQPERGGPAKLAIFVTRAQKKDLRNRELTVAAEKRKRELIQSTEGKNMYVKNLDERVDEEELKKFFGAYGTITSARIQRDADGRSRMFGFVCFSTREEAQKALHEANRRVLLGKPLYVAVWQPKDRRQAYLAQTFQAHNMGGAGMGMPMGMPVRAPVPMRGPAGMGSYGGMPGFAQPMFGGRGFGGQGVMMQPGMGGMSVTGMQMAGMVMTGPQGGRRVHPAAASGAPPATTGAPQQRGFAAVAAGVPAAGARGTTTAPGPAPVPTTATRPAPAGGAAPPQFTSAQLIEMEPKQRQQVIGTRLFPLVRAIDPDRAPKITGMLLNGMEAGDLLNLLESSTDLQQAVRDAQAVLDRQPAPTA